jgi:hypothetical protein
VETYERTVELRLIERGMPVRDARGEKIGAVAHLHQPIGVAGPGADPVAAAVIEVKTGFLGTGERLYIPLGTVGRLAHDGLYLTEPRGAIGADPEWRTRPSHLPAEGADADHGRRFARPDDWYRPFK